MLPPLFPCHYPNPYLRGFFLILSNYLYISYQGGMFHEVEKV